MIGQFGDAEIFSFHATKLVNSLEGGAIVTNNGELAEKIRLMKNFGFSGEDNVTYIGTNGKMSEISAAMGICSLDKIDYFIYTNRRNFNQYKEHLDGLAGIDLLEYDETDLCTYPYITITIDKERTKLTRDEILLLLKAENILARRYFYPGCHRMEPYKSFFPNAGFLLANTNYFMERVICLPTGTAVSPDDIKKICNILRFIVENARSIKDQLGSNICVA
jgi:dTDP-4-amino-4,6-dideoxygalactose transaminase